MVKSRLTQHQHIELGRPLAGIQDELVTQRTMLLNAYPRSGQESAPAAKLADAIEALVGARSNLEEAAFREHPATAATTDYWPHREHRAVVAHPGKYQR